MLQTPFTDFIGAKLISRHFSVSEGHLILHLASRTDFHHGLSAAGIGKSNDQVSERNLATARQPRGRGAVDGIKALGMESHAWPAARVLSNLVLWDGKWKLNFSRATLANIDVAYNIVAYAFAGTPLLFTNTCFPGQAGSVDQMQLPRSTQLVKQSGWCLSTRSFIWSPILW